jgi:2-keto-4-pentenoate hydratase
MMDSDLTDRLVAAQRVGSNTVDPTPYATLDRPTAYRIQTGVLAGLGERAGMLKTAIHADGVGVVAPIYASKVGSAPCRLSATNVIGLEVEVGVMLARDIGALDTDDEASIASAVDHYFLGVEICGSRFPDRKAAGPIGGLADNMTGLGYVIGPKRRDGQIEGLQVKLEFGGKVIHDAPPKHAFRTVLASLVAYAKSQHPAYPLVAGTIVTTGSMCGLVAASGPGNVRASLGAESLEFDLV